MSQLFKDITIPSLRFNNFRSADEITLHTWKLPEALKNLITK